MIIYPHQAAGEGHDFAKGDQEAFVDLSLRLDVDTAEEERESAKGEDGCHN